MSPNRHREKGVSRGFVLSVLGFSLLFTSLSGSEPLHRRIDELVSRGNVTPIGERADDAEFLRRVYLDLLGTIPTPEQLRSFLADTSPGKRAGVVDRLLSRPGHFRHLATTFDVWLMERRRDAHVKSADWRDFLERSFAEGKPYDELVREILAADGTGERNRAASRFYLDRLGEPNLISRDVGRIFYGRDLQCAQCHDHPTISDYLQRDYHGMLAFFGRTYLFQPDRKKPAVLAEKAEGGGEFKSVFTSVEAVELPRLIKSSLTYADPDFEPGEEYRVKPDPKKKNLQPIPKYSRRAQVVRAMGEVGNPAFDRNIANRLWAHMMGRGLVEPLDFHHASNPPTHPELLETLASAFREMEYDVGGFLRELALSDTYQRRFEPPAASIREARDRVEGSLDALNGEEERRRERSLAAAEALDGAKIAWNAARIEAAVPEAQLAKAGKNLAAAEANLEKEREALAGAEAELEKIVATTAEGKTDPEQVKREGVVAAREKAVKAAAEKVEALREVTLKWEKEADAGRQKVERATAHLERCREEFERDRAAWKLALRKVRDARELIACAEVAGEFESASGEAGRLSEALAEWSRREEASREEAARREKVAAKAQAARFESPFDDALVNESNDRGRRAVEARAAADEAARRFSEVKRAAEAAAARVESLREKRAIALESMTERWAAAFAVGSFTQLTPEQLCHAMLTATGEVDKFRAAGKAEFEKKLAAQEAANKKAAEKPDPKKKGAPESPPLTEADRESYVRDDGYRRIDAAAATFVRLFGGQAGAPQGEFFATADQALFLSNGGTVRAWLRPSGDNLTGRLLRMEDPGDIARELYFGILTREPDSVELDAVRNYLEQRPGEKSEALQELGWALLTSVEFRFKH